MGGIKGGRKGGGGEDGEKGEGWGEVGGGPRLTMMPCSSPNCISRGSALRGARFAQSKAPLTLFFGLKNT